MLKFTRVITMISVLTTTACAYNAPVDVSPAYDVYSNYDDKLPGSYALYVDSEKMNAIAKVRGFACSAHSYPVDATDQFATSVAATFRNLMDSVEMVDQPLSQSDMEARGIDAMIIVEAMEYDIRLRVIPGFWSSEMEADVDIAARIKVDAQGERKLGSSVEGSGDSLVEAGMACEGGSQAIGEATGDAIKETMERLGERISNARKLRSE